MLHKFYTCRPLEDIEKLIENFKRLIREQPAHKKSDLVIFELAILIYCTLHN